jgi:hypothetical protein
VCVCVCISNLPAVTLESFMRPGTKGHPNAMFLAVSLLKYSELNVRISHFRYALVFSPSLMYTS